MRIKLNPQNLDKLLDYYKQLEPCVTGYYGRNTARGRPASAISVCEPSAAKIIQARKIVTAWHPLLSYHPDQWLNIPIMIV